MQHASSLGKEKISLFRSAWERAKIPAVSAPETPAQDPSAEALQVEPLSAELARLRAENEALDEEAWRQRALLGVSQETIALFDKGVVVDVNRQFEPMFRYTREEAIGKHALEFVAPESKELVAHNQRTGYAEPYEATLVRKDGTTFVARIRGCPVERKGRILRVSAFTDLTQQKLAEQAIAHSVVQAEMIRLQADLLARLSTPLLPIGNHALVLPLIGQINGARAGQVMDALTEGVVAHGARYAILDVTGVDTLDAQVAELLVAASKVVRMLGAKALLTGIRPDVARMLVEIGSDLSGLVTFATLEQGVAFAFGRR